ncbi:unnamed protein product [Adineta steineri]|uniref:Uncharacterized protein n=1 Tax=Adineta steineri TaxID=433720 RepID=A0A815UQ54_9BILA|nr:unnamed protein product [Adineta steineri]CAF1525910.1 unnamed protein product [Adineta steineri]
MPFAIPYVLRRSSRLCSNLTICCSGFNTPCVPCTDTNNNYGLVYCYNDLNNYGNLYGLLSDCVSDYNSSDNGVSRSYGYYHCIDGTYSSGSGTLPSG